MQTINDHNVIDLNKHALIEASAGTGKTYTIENLVVRMLIEKDLTLENILLLTFTEKATGELKKRIRGNITSELQKVRGDNEKAKKLQESLVNFDTASIYTIHGFCQCILRDFSFEIGQSFDFEVVRDEPLYVKLLYEQMRKSWHNEFGGDLPELLEVSNFPSVNRMRGGSQWISKVIRVAQSCHFRMNDHIEPEISDGVTLSDIKNRTKERLQNILQMIGYIDKNNLENSDFCCAYNALNFNKKSKKSRLERIILPLLRFLNEFNAGDKFNINDLFTIFEDIPLDDYKKKGIHCLIPDKWNKGVSNLDEKCPELAKILSVLDQIITDIAIVSYILPVNSIKQLGKDVARYKTQNGLISFNDMLVHVAEAIDNENNKTQLEKLRTRYKYALVDEFQDTDAIQWKIFHEIFIKGESQKLFLIGDPKQAIYSFRGADVFTYLDARKELKAIAHKGKAMVYSLETNYRSGPKLINAFNHLFKQHDWFGGNNAEPDDEKIGYHDALSSKKVIDALSNEKERAPFTVVTINNEDKSSVARRRFAEFVAFEIDYIVGRESIKDDNEERKLNYGDICILVRSKSEVPVIETELDILNMPHTYYKKPGLYQSDEAMELLFLFRFIETPNDESATKKGLLTPFFCIAVNELNNYVELSPAHSVKILIGKWHEFALYRKWPQLFQSIIEDSGLLIRESREPKGERRLTNYRHIMQNLENIANDQSLDFTGIINCLESFRSEVLEVEMEMDVHQIESERSRVKIMTIHSSKGLEFPIVFLAGGFTKSAYSLFHKYHENGTVIYDLTKNNYGKEKQQAEDELENRRLYYVALTRAVYRVYLPEHKPLKGTQHAGPVASFIYNSIQSMKDDWKESDRNGCLRFIDVKTGKHEIKQRQSIGSTEEINIPDQVFPPENFDFWQRMVRAESFSSISKKASVHKHVELLLPESITYHDTGREINDEETEQLAVNVTKSETTDTQELPRGKHTGNMLHEVMENINFAKVAKAKCEGKDYNYLLKESETATLIEERLFLNSIGIEHKEAAAKIVWDVLVTPIITIDNDLVLSNLNDDNRIHELEFYYPSANSELLVLPDGINCKDGFYTGFIDMVFRHKERYYIVDWKSNYIADGYSRQHMENSMKESDYHSQCMIYTDALILWLKQCLSDSFDYEKHFGGAFYLFLRGMATGAGNGVYYYSPDMLKAAISNQ